nr:hypothetical protein [Tanacetum cinerariifolium]
MKAEESSFDIESEIKFFGKMDTGQEIKNDADITFMPDDELMGLRLTRLFDTLVSIANKEGIDTTVFAASDPTVSSMYASSSVPITTQKDVQALIAKAVWEKKNIP